ncbi:hypothetical protein ACFPES_03195 [Paenibacillus sp. GCM10023248]|uniref:hypothetical protein n=1 Tax=unclassified Paenibacillus TaxID=185978 RepID=UPI00237854F1|nr:hypothetical protein [Paenibacillus sp. MAHUQ-63]MDD9266031.1 hypothetical protein [Paenibacillus sp. MAHUQ-63]
MSSTFDELTETFFHLYGKGYRFVETLEDQVVVEQIGVSKVVTPIMKRGGLLIDGIKLSDEEIEMGINFFAFKRSIKLKNGKPL